MEVISDPHIRYWLSTLGYAVMGAHREVVRALFGKEARQWQLSTDELEEMVRETYEARRRALREAREARSEGSSQQARAPHPRTGPARFSRMHGPAADAGPEAGRRGPVAWT